jgi:hypothetical protein
MIGDYATIQKEVVWPISTHYPQLKEQRRAIFRNSGKSQLGTSKYTA